MVARKALVLISGDIQELPSGDTLTGAGGGDISWTLAGSYTFASAAASSGSITLSAYDRLWVILKLISLSSADVPVLRFNGDTGTNYRYRFSYVSDGAGSTFSNSGSGNVGYAPLYPPAATQTRRMSIQMMIDNESARTKLGYPICMGIAAETANVPANNPGYFFNGAFEWANTSAQITSAELTTTGGTANFGVNSAIKFYGRNF